MIQPADQRDLDRFPAIHVAPRVLRRQMREQDRGKGVVTLLQLGGAAPPVRQLADRKVEGEGAVPQLLGVDPSILGPTNLTRVQSSSYTGGARIDIRGEQGRMGMVSIPIEAQVSPEQLLQAVEQLPPDEFSAFVARLLDLQARRSRQSEEPVEVAHDQRMAQLAAEVRTSRQRVLGLHKGAVTISEDFDDPLPDDFWLGNE
jgi:hypothetical protein